MERILRGIEVLPHTSERLKENICMILAILDSRLCDIDVGEIVSKASLLHATALLSKGTGFLTSKGYVVTAYHVVKGAHRIVGLTPHGSYLRLNLVKYHDKHDLALLEPETCWSNGVNVEFKEGSQFSKGEVVFTLGYPLAYSGPEPILTVGFLSNLQEKEGTKRLVVNAALNIGNSGGPLFNLQGRLLGVVTARSIFPSPIVSLALQVFSRPGVDLVYGELELPGGVKEEVSLSKIMLSLIKWVMDNIQTNIGEAVSAEHLIELLD